MFLMTRFIGILISSLPPAEYGSLCWLCTSASTNSKSKKYSIIGTVNRTVTSAKVLPRQTLFPPMNGVNANGFLGLPSAVSAHLLSLFLLSNRKGSYLDGSGHWYGSW